VAVAQPVKGVGWTDLVRLNLRLSAHAVVCMDIRPTVSTPRWQTLFFLLPLPRSCTRRPKDGAAEVCFCQSSAALVLSSGRKDSKPDNRKNTSRCVLSVVSAALVLSSRREDSKSQTAEQTVVPHPRPPCLKPSERTAVVAAGGCSQNKRQGIQVREQSTTVSREKMLSRVLFRLLTVCFVSPSVW